eukprot:Skav226684  [mRNA]  locus=scaffold3971:62939:80133:- [translate_table: standard]
MARYTNTSKTAVGGWLREPRRDGTQWNTVDSLKKFSLGSLISRHAREVDEEEVLFNFRKPSKKKGFDPNWKRPFPKYIVMGGVMMTVIGYLGGGPILSAVWGLCGAGFGLPVLGGAQIIAFCGLIETTGFFQASSTTDGRGAREGQFSMKDSTEAAEPGNYGVGFPTFIGKVEDPEARKSKLSAELANGRLAMMAIIGMFFQDGLTGSAWGDWSLYTASPLRAEAEEEAPAPPPFDPRLEVGVLPPLDYFDPAGFCKVGDEAMMAALGAAVQHYVQFPGFEEVPTGLGAVTTAPGTYGFAALFLISGVLELALWTEDVDVTMSNEQFNFDKMARNTMDDLLGPPSNGQQYGQQQYVPGTEYYTPPPAPDPGKTVDLSGAHGANASSYSTPQPGPSFRPSSGGSSFNGGSSSTGYGRGPSSFEGGAGPTLSLASLSPPAIMQQLTSRPLTEVVSAQVQESFEVQCSSSAVPATMERAKTSAEDQLKSSRKLAGVGGGWSHAMRSDQFRNRPWTLQIGVSAELEKVLTERKVLQGQRHELRVRINEAPQKLHALRQKIRKSLKAQAEIARLQRLYKAKIARDRNAATCAATALSSSSLFEEAQLLEYMGLEPDLPCLLLEAWSKEEGISVLLGEQWLNWGVLGDARQRIEVALEPRVLLSRNEKKTNIQSTCGGSLLGTSGSRGSLLLHFSCKDTNLEKDKVLFDLHLSSKRPWKQSVIPTAVALKVWSWGGSAESLKAQTTSEGSQVRQKTVERITCWLQAIEGCHKTDSKVSEIPSGDGGDWLQVGSSGDEVLVIGRHHSLFQRLLEDKKDYLSCISREHLRLWFDSKSEILYIENLSNNPIAVQDRVDSEPSTIASGKVARTKHGDLLRFIAPESLRKVDAVHGAFLSFRIVVQKPRRLSNCAGKNCKGGGGDPLYTVNATDETSDGQFLYCGSCCVQLHLANPSYTFRQTSETLRPRWKLLCESHAAVKTSKHVETYPTSQLPRGSASQLPSGLWVADFGTQKLHLPVAVHEGATLNEKQARPGAAMLDLNRWLSSCLNAIKSNMQYVAKCHSNSSVIFVLRLLRNSGWMICPIV